MKPKNQQRVTTHVTTPRSYVIRWGGLDGLPAAFFERIKMYTKGKLSQTGEVSDGVIYIWDSKKNHPFASYNPYPLGHVQRKANAAELVRRWNAYERLLIACENLARGQMQHPTFEGYVSHAVWVAEEAIAATKPEQAVEGD